MNVAVLAPDVIAKIAAGEVVDRPSSVVKELLENSLDAGASRIEVHLKDAGKELIHIKDNGHGIGKADIERLFSRHATSKIKNIEDLEKLHSMGFRGEALYSIAAVSDIVLRSQSKDAGEAWSTHLRGGQRLDLAPCAPMGQGTDIKVSELFYNVPARRKFLKSNTSEMNQIVGAFLPYALIYPEKYFVLTHTGKVLLDLKVASSRLDRVAAALNLDQKDLLEAVQDYGPEGISIKAALGNINCQRPRRDLQYIFVNNRPVQSKALSFTMNDVYRALLPPGVYPVFVLQIAIDPALVDANIHPTKREVRLKDEARLCSILRHLTEHTLMRLGNARTIEEHSSPAFSGVPAEQLVFAASQLREAPSRYQSYASDAPPEADLFNAHSNENLPAKFGRASFIGAFMNKYLLFEEGTSLFLVDQHAAQERIMFELFRQQIENGKIEVQPLLTPLLLKLNLQEQIAWEEAAEKLKSVGIETALFDEETLAIHTQPVLLKNLERAVRGLLSGQDIARCDAATIARRACKASIVSGDPLSPAQADYQRKQLLACQDPFTCPHGRPTVIELKESFLDRQFLRS